jgi:hypothetical protein
VLRRQRRDVRRRAPAREADILAEASTLAPNTRALVVTAHSRVTTIAALTGQKIGVNGSIASAPC